jgi:hypothetical protein
MHMRATVLMGSWPESAAEAHNAFDASVAVSRTRTQIARRPQWVAAISVFVAYYLGSKIGFLLTFQPHPVSVLWPPNSILLAALLLTPARTWWLALLAAFPAHLAAQLQSNVPPAMLLCWFISNSCEALIGAGCVRYLIRGPVRFDRLRDVGIFCGFAAVAGPFLSSFVDAGFVALNHWGQDGYWQVWRIRFTSNVLATLTLVPLIVSWSRGGIDWLGRIGARPGFRAALSAPALFDLGCGALRRARGERGHLRGDFFCHLECWSRLWAVLDKVAGRECALDSDVPDCDFNSVAPSARLY